MDSILSGFTVYHLESIDDMLEIIGGNFKHDDQKKTSPHVRMVDGLPEVMVKNSSHGASHHQSTSIEERSAVIMYSSEDLSNNAALSISSVWRALLPFATGGKSLRDILSNHQRFFSESKPDFPGKKLNRLLDSVHVGPGGKVETQKEFDQLLGELSIKKYRSESVVENTCSVLSWCLVRIFRFFDGSRTGDSQEVLMRKFYHIFFSVSKLQARGALSE